MPLPVSAALDHWLARGRFWPCQGYRHFVASAGHGPALLLLHGYPTGSFDWQPLWPRLSAHRRLIAPDFLGLGFSDKPAEALYTISAHADRIEQLLAEEGIDALSIVAHDLGVSVAQELLARVQEGRSRLHIHALVLLNGGLCPEAYQPRFIQRLLASPLGAWIGPRVSRAAFERTLRELFAAQPPAALLDDFWTLLEHQQGRRVAHRTGAFWRDRMAQRDRLVQALLSSRRPPLRLINGSADPNSGRHMADAFLALSPSTEVVHLPDVGHWPQWEAADAVSAALLGFLESHPAAATP